MEPVSPNLFNPWRDLFDAAPGLYVGFSGGLDSSVLLALLAESPWRSKLAAIHVDHRLSPNSASWRSHCHEVCAALDIPLITEEVDIRDAGDGIESAARQARYRVFEHRLIPGDVLLLGHHLDDQVETVLFRMLRGSGPRGLAGIPRVRGLARAYIVRPLLDCPRSFLEAAARSRSMTWVEDESNASADIDRNYLRHNVLPVIAERWPDYRRRLSRSAEQCHDSALLLAELADGDLDTLGETAARLGWRLDIKGFAALSGSRQRNLLRHWLLRRGFRLPSHRALEAVLTDLLAAAEDAAPRVEAGGGQFRRFDGYLYLLPAPGLDRGTCDDVTPWNMKQSLPVAGGFQLQAVLDPSGWLRVAPDAQVEIRYRRGGERCRPVNKPGSGTLKKWLNAYRLEPWLRDWVPLVYVNGELAAVGDLFVCNGWQAVPGEPALRLQWQGPAPDLSGGNGPPDDAFR